MSPIYRWPLILFGCVLLAAAAVAVIEHLQRPPVVPPPVPPAPRPPREKPPLPPLIPGTNLTEVAVTLDLSDSSKPVDPVVFFEAPDVYDDSEHPFVTPLLQRELYRQGVLLAARHELGLAPRDALLGEAAPADLPPNNRIRVNPSFTISKKTELTIECGPTAASRLAWKATGQDHMAVNETYAQSLASAEIFSRDKYVTALKRTGLHGKAVPVVPTVVVPEGTEARLRKMTVPDQFAALRELHALVKARGESPAVLVGLARAYGNLAMLTERQLDAMTWVFKARALLYGERLRARDPAAPWGHWARAYAAALVGLHKVALDDLAAAEKVRGEVAVPAWVSLADALCRFDTARLEAVPADSPMADTAAVFRFLTVEDPLCKPRMMAAAKVVLARVPECYRVHGAVEEMLIPTEPHPAKRSGFEEFTASFPGRVREMPALPAAVAERAAAAGPEAGLVNTLTEAGRSRVDRGEPTWAALGRYARETRMNQISGRGNVHWGGLPDALKDMRPMLEDHPVWRLLAFAREGGRTAAQFEQGLNAIKFPELTYRYDHLMPIFYRTGHLAGSKYHSLAMSFGGEQYYDKYVVMRTLRPELSYSDVAKRMYAVSPHAPLARALLIRDDWKFAEPHAAAWEAEARHPDVFLMLARQSLNRQRPADAIRQALEALRLSPQLESYQALAEARLINGQEDLYVSTLEEFLKTPASGQDLARARTDIVDYYLARKEVDKAQPYADAAASASLHTWAVECTARCAEGRGEWDLAEQIVSGLDSRCGECHFLLYYWRLRTGRGDLAASQAVVDKHLPTIKSPPEAADVMLSGVAHSVAGRHAQAAEFYQRHHRQLRDEIFALAAAAEFDAAKDAPRRDAALKLIRADSPFTISVPFIQDRLAKKNARLPTEEEIEAEMKKLPPAHAREFRYVVGRFLQNRGANELATAYLRRAGEYLPGSRKLAPLLAALALREMEKK